MQSDSEKANKTDARVPKKAGARAIFSEAEIRDTIKGFISGWLKGNVKINFPNAQELYQRSQFEKRKISFEEATQKELSGKNFFKDLINICTGVKPASPEGLQEANDELFDYILSYREGDRIEGEIVEYSIQERLSKLEEGLKVTNDLVQELVVSVRELIAFHQKEMGMS